MDIKDLKTRHIFLRLKWPVIAVFLVYIAGWINVYSVNDWVQHRVKTLMYPNETLQSYGACSNHTDPDYDKLARVQRETSRWLMYNTIALKTASPIVAFVCTIFTDIYGRKFLFIYAYFGQVLYYLLAALIVFFNMDFIYLVIANIIYGLTGVGLLAVTYSHIADITQSGNERALATTLVSIATYIPGTIGSLSTGLFIEKSGFALPAFTAAGISLISFLIACCLIQETVTKPAKGARKRPRLTAIIRDPFAFYFSKTFKGSRRLYLLLLFAFVFADMSTEHRKTMENLYLLGMPFCWKPFKIGLFAAAISTSANFVGFAALNLMQRKLLNPTIAIMSSSVTLLSFVMEAFARADVVLYLVAIPTCLSTLSAPLIRSTMSSMTSEQLQGTLAAGLLVVQTLCSVITSVTDNKVYQATVSFFSGFIFLVFASYCLLTAIFLLTTIGVSNSLDPDQDRHSVGLHLGSNCLQEGYWQTTKLSTGMQRVITGFTDFIARGVKSF